jgi:hypothetical protein
MKRKQHALMKGVQKFTHCYVVNIDIQQADAFPGNRLLF